MDVENLKHYADTLERQAVENEKAATAAFRASLNSPPLAMHLDRQWLKETASELYGLAKWARKLAAEIKAKIAV